MAPNSLHLFEQRVKAGLLSVTDDVDEKAFIEKHPFGGIHVIFGGDFYQLGTLLFALHRYPYEYIPTCNSLYTYTNVTTELTRSCCCKE